MDLAKKAFGCNNFKLATDIFDHLLQAHGPNMDWLISRGDAYVRQGKMNEALADYVHAFRLGEVRPGCLHELVNALVAAVASQGQLADRLAQHRVRLKGRPLDAFTCRACQGLLYEPATLPCGHTFCKDCLSHVQDSWTCLKCQAKPDKRSNCNMNIVLSRLLEKYFPEETKSRRLRAEGNKLYAQRKHKEAIKKYTESHELVPSDHFVLSNRSHVYTVLEQYEEALLDAEHACQLKPDWAKGYYRKGVALAGLGRQEEALVAFLQSLTLDGLATSARKSLEKVLHDLLSPVQPASIKRLELERGLRRPLASGGSSLAPGILSKGITDLAEEVVLRLEAVSHLYTEESEEGQAGSAEGATCAKEAPPTEAAAPAADATPPTVTTPTLGAAFPPRTSADVATPLASSDPSPQTSQSGQQLGVKRDMSVSELVSLRKRKRYLSGGDALVSPNYKMDFKFPRVDAFKMRTVPKGLIDKEDYECSLCFRLYLEPLTTPCGHTFCKLCLNRSLDYNNSCPLCKESLAEYLANRINTVTELVLYLLQECLGEEYREREEQHKSQMEAMSRFVREQTECEVPIFVCTLAFPTIPCPLHIFEPRYRLMVRQTMNSGACQFGMCLPDPNNPEGHLDIGCMLEIEQVQNLPDGRSVIKTTGGRRFKVLSRGMRDGYNTSVVRFIRDTEVTGEEVAVVTALEQEVHQRAKSWFSSLPIMHQTRILAHFGPTPEREEDPLACSQGPSWTWWLLAILPVNQRIQHAILAMPSLKERLTALQRCLARIANLQF